MMADWRFNGHGTVEMYRRQNAIYAIKDYIYRSIKKGQIKEISLDYIVTSDTSIIDFIPDNSKTSDAITLEKESKDSLSKKIDELLKSKLISREQERYLRAFYFDGESMDIIAKKEGITRQGVHVSIKNAIQKLKGLAEKDKALMEIAHEC